jgi:hypothetical protein
MKKISKPKTKSTFDRDYVVKGQKAVYRGKSSDINMDKLLKEMKKRGLKKLEFK